MSAWKRILSDEAADADRAERDRPRVWLSSEPMSAAMREMTDIAPGDDDLFMSVAASEVARNAKPYPDPPHEIGI